MLDKYKVILYFDDNFRQDDISLLQVATLRVQVASLEAELETVRATDPAGAGTGPMLLIRAMP